MRPQFAVNYTKNIKCCSPAIYRIFFLPHEYYYYSEKEECPMQEKTVKQDQNLILENRKNLSISGITDVDSFDEKSIELYTQLGELTIQGRELHIDSMSVETGDMTITGDIWAIVYGDKDRKGPISALGKLFR